MKGNKKKMLLLVRYPMLSPTREKSSLNRSAALRFRDMFARAGPTIFMPRATLCVVGNHNSEIKKVDQRFLCAVKSFTNQE